jgi:uncharacterized coiled-coil DUF342 family protein
MSRSKLTLTVLLVALLGVWGCAQGPTGGPAVDAERIKALEAKNARLQDDYRAAAAARDLLRQKLAQAEELNAQVHQEVEQLQEIAKERDDLRHQLQMRVLERDGVQAQFEQFRREIRQLLGEADAAATSAPANPVTSGPTLQTANRS